MHKHTLFLWCCVLFISGTAAAVFGVPGGAPVNPLRTGVFGQWFDKKIFMRATVSEDPVYTQDAVRGTQFKAVVTPNGDSAKIILRGPARQLEYGDALIVIGKLQQPQNSPDFDYADWLAAHGIFGQISYPEIYIVGKNSGNPVLYQILRAKHWLFGRIKTLLPAPQTLAGQSDRTASQQAGLLIALISGERADMPADSVNAFNLVGAAHMIAISGYKLTLVLIAIEALGRRLRRRYTLAAEISFAFFYFASTGFAPAVFRAVVMSAMFVWAKSRGRDYFIFSGLVVTAAIILALNPEAIRYDLGFILSFSGILGIIAFGPFCKKMLVRVPEFLGFKEVFIGSLCAQIATAPLMALYFHQFSAVGPLSNMLLVPLLAPSILLGYASALPIAGALFAHANLIILNYMLWAVKICVSIPGAYALVTINGYAAAALYALELGGWLLLKKPKRSATI